MGQNEAADALRIRHPQLARANLSQFPAQTFHLPRPNLPSSPAKTILSMAIKQCSKCERTFTKAEHLKRHERSRMSTASWPRAAKH